MPLITLRSLLSISILCFLCLFDRVQLPANNNPVYHRSFPFPSTWLPASIHRGTIGVVRTIHHRTFSLLPLLLVLVCLLCFLPSNLSSPQVFSSAPRTSSLNTLLPFVKSVPFACFRVMQLFPTALSFFAILTIHIGRRISLICHFYPSTAKTWCNPKPPKLAARRLLTNW